MARNKYPEITVNRILDISLKLFLEKGYEKTTIQDIVDNLGDLSKGAIYHHFKSKEEIIDAVTLRMYQDSNSFDKIKDDRSLNGLQKIKEIFSQSISNKEQQKFYRSSPTLMKNPKFLSRQLNQAVSRYAPLLKEVIEEGMKDGSINATYPKELSEVVMLLLNIWLNPSVFVVSKEQFIEKINFLKKLFDGMGLPVIDDDIIEALNDFHDFTLV
ncbi:TetR/AcrR family transcriptional regulator [Clostridium sediminicola]|uniref:TetR/AcrR family transcriptional regulator n=1 Tax=Clostridium sediminicola TaxID=3114879 RepID=UPI0031F20E27